MSAPLIEKGYTKVDTGWWGFLEIEETPELRWPSSIEVYDRMRRQDAQVISVLRAVTLPIRRTAWRIDPAGAKASVTKLVAEDLGLPIQGAKPLRTLRTRDRFSWADHLRLSLLMLPFGHSIFEQTYRVVNGQQRLRKLGWRPPRTIAKIAVADDGGLLYIQQHKLPGTSGTEGPKIPVDNLVAYVNDREGGNWLGQALAPSTPVPTPDGWRMMADLRPGDRVFDENGMIRHVTARRDWADRPCYRVQFADGESIVADENHQWLTEDFRSRCLGRGGPEVRTTSEIAATVTAYKSGTTNHSIPLAKPVQHVARRLIVDPYILGYWLGDGCKGSGRIVTADEQVIDLFAERGYVCDHEPRDDRQWGFKGLATDLRYAGVIDHKHVPEEYLVGSVEQRLELLRGLMDSDGTITREGQCVFANTDPLLVSAVLELVRSLGIRATARICRQAGRTAVGPNGLTITSRRDVWHVQFATHLPVFALDRKLERLRPDNIRRRNHMVVSVEAVDRQATICIEVDSPSHLFLAGRNFVPTHNSLLRPAYKSWLLKDRALRTQAQTLDRNGLGVPYYEASEMPAGLTDPDEIKKRQDDEVAAGLQMASAYRGGQNSGAAGPHGAQLTLLGVQGTLPDADKSIRLHDEHIARAVLANFLNLGGDNSTGSYALGSEFVDFFVASLQTVAETQADITNQHVIEDLVDINFGPDEPAPRLVFDEIGASHPATADAIQKLVQCRAITADDDLERHLRTTYNLPAPDPTTARQQPVPSTPTNGGAA